MDVILSPSVQSLVDAQRAALTSIHDLLKRLETDREVLDQLQDLIDNLEALFLVVVVGEFNAGKSSVLNALFGERIMQEGPIPTTAKITVLRYGEEPLERQLSEYLVERRYPAELLKYLNLVDTPGTNSIVRRHQEITEDFIPRSDLILFITSFDRPLSESERQFLSFIRESWGKRLVFVLNKIDLSDENGNELQQVIDYIATTTRELMGFEPRIIPVSAELAFAAKKEDSSVRRKELWERSRFEEFETFLNDRLSGPEQLALKLSSPLDTGSKLLEGMGTRLDARRTLLQDDEQQLNALYEHFEETEKALREGYSRYLAETDNLLLRMERRGVQFLDDNIRVSKIRLLKDRDAFKQEFERQVVRGNEREIEDHLTEAVDWLLRHVVGLWNWTLGRFNAQIRSRVPHDLPAESEFLYNRAEVFQNIRREAERRISSYDLNEEGRRILENARSAAALFLGAEGLAAGIGAIAAVVIATTAADVTGGFVAAGVLALFGFIFLPRQKRKAEKEFRERVEELRKDLETALRTQFDLEIDSALARVRALIEPFAAFVSREQQMLKEAVEERKALNTEIDRLREQVQKQFGTPEIGN